MGAWESNLGAKQGCKLRICYGNNGVKIVNELIDHDYDCKTYPLVLLVLSDLMHMMFNCLLKNDDLIIMINNINFMAWNLKL